MPKTAKKVSAKKRAPKLPAALKGLQNSAIGEGGFGAHVAQASTELARSGINAGFGSIYSVGRIADGSGIVQVDIDSGGFVSVWPEWAYGVAEAALHWGRKVLIVYKDQPIGSNLMQVVCTRDSA